MNVIRRAVADDGPEVSALFRRSFGALAFLPELHTPEEDRGFFAAVIDEQQVWVWDEHGQVMGFAALGDTMLNHLYVEPGEQRRGIGTALLEHAKQCRPEGLQLWTFQRNDGARRFYERHGFDAVTTTDGSGNEEQEPDVLYEWRPT